MSESPTRPSRRLDPGHGLTSPPPRVLGLGDFYRLSTCSPIGAVALAAVLVGTVIEVFLIVGHLAGAEMAGLERYGALSFHALFGGLLLLGVLLYVAFGVARRRHLRFVREGEAKEGEVVAVEVIGRSTWWRRGGRLSFLARRSRDMGRFRVHYGYVVDGEQLEGIDVIDTRHGNGQLCLLPTPQPGDRLTVLYDPEHPDDSVLALGVGAGLKDP